MLQSSGGNAQGSLQDLALISRNWLPAPRGRRMSCRCVILCYPGLWCPYSHAHGTSRLLQLA